MHSFFYLILVACGDDEFTTTDTNSHIHAVRVIAPSGNVAGTQSRQSVLRAATINSGDHSNTAAGHISAQHKCAFAHSYTPDCNSQPICDREESNSCAMVILLLLAKIFKQSLIITRKSRSAIQAKFDLARAYRADGMFEQALRSLQIFNSQEK